MFHDGIKTVSLAEMENAIGQALSKVTGVRYTCNISNLDLTEPEAKISISLTGPNFFDTVSHAEADADG